MINKNYNTAENDICVIGFCHIWYVLPQGQSQGTLTVIQHQAGDLSSDTLLTEAIMAAIISTFVSKILVLKQEEIDERIFT